MLGQFAAQTGYWSFYVAQAWLALQLTNDPAWVTVITTAGLMPFLLLSIPAGALADRVDRKRLVVVARVLAVIAFAAESLLVASGAITPWQMFLIAALAGAAIVTDNPAQYSLVGDFVPPEAIPSAASLISANLQLSIIAGPLLGGFVLAASGPAAGIALAAVGNCLLVLTYLPMRIPRRAPGTGSSMVQAVQGLRFVLTNYTVGICALILAAAVLVVQPYQALMSVFVRDELHLGGFELGLLLTAPGVGALAGSAIAAYDRLVPPKLGTMAAAMGLSGTALAVLGWATGLGSALLLLGLLGFAWGVVFVLGTSIPLLATPQRLRGRVLSIFLMMWGMTPVGSTLAGVVADGAGTRTVFALAGQITVAFAGAMLVFLAAASFARRRRWRSAAAPLMAESGLIVLSRKARD